MKFKRYIGLMLSLVLVSGTVTGCQFDLKGIKTNGSELDIPKVSQLTQQEVIDYYAQEMSYATLVKRRSRNSTLELNPVTDEDTIAKVTEAYDGALSMHQKTKSSKKNRSKHEYIKTSLDGFTLDNGQVEGVYEATGYYFLTMNYDLSPSGTGVMRKQANYLGINGMFVKDADNRTQISKTYLKAALKLINEKRDENEEEHIADATEIERGAHSREDANELSDTDGVSGESESFCDNALKLSWDINEFNSVVGTNKDQVAFMPEITHVFEAVEEGELSGYGMYAEGANGLADFGYNRDDIRGTAQLTYVFKQDSKVPDKLTYSFCYINSINNENRFEFDNGEYKDLQNEGDGLAGSIEGNNGTTGADEGIDTSVDDTSGESTADGETGEGSTESGTDDGTGSTGTDDEGSGLTKIEEQDDSKTTGAEKDAFTEAEKKDKDNGITVPDFVLSELKQVIERADRSVNNADVAGLMGGNIVEDAGAGLQLGQYGEYVNIVYYISNLDKIMQRNGNVYLCRVERFVEDSGYWDGSTAKYTDVLYYVIRQDGLDFKINDYVLVSRNLESMPTPDGDASIVRRLTALNLSGEVTDKQKEGVTSLLSDLYSASTNRILEGGLNDAGEFVPGMYDCFNTDTDLLTEERKEYLNSQIRGRLTKHGTNIGAKYSGIVIQWVGGNDKQCELATEELIEYEGINEGLYLQTYYLVSNYDGKWKIDDITTMKSQTVTDSELDTLMSRIDSGSAPAADEADGESDYVSDEYYEDTTSDSETDTEE